MEITINLMTVLYVVLAYLAVGYIVVLGWGLHDIEKNLSSVSKEERNRRKIKQLYWSLLFSWGFPYLLWSEIPEKVKSSRRKKLQNGHFLNDVGEPLTYRQIENEYAEYADEHFDEYYIGQEADIYKYAKENYATAK